MQPKHHPVMRMHVQRKALKHLAFPPLMRLPVVWVIMVVMTWALVTWPIGNYLPWVALPQTQNSHMW